MADDILHHFQAHLIARGFVRKPSDGSASAALPPLYIEPRTGTPAPGEVRGVEAHPTMALGIVRATPIAVGPYESWFWRPVVDLWYRVRNAKDLRAIEDQVRGEFEDRRAWVMSTGLFVIESGVWRETQRLGSDEKSFTYMGSFHFQLYSGRAPRDGS